MKPSLLLKIGCLLACVFGAGQAFALPDTARVPATVGPSGVSVRIPAHAVEVAPDVFSLGTAVVDGQVVEGIMIVDRQGAVRPGSGGGGGSSSCYAFLAQGAKWKTVEPWLLNPANTQGFSDSFVLENLTADLQKWEDASGTDIFGNGTVTSASIAPDVSSPDGVNEVVFGSIDSAGAIAVTTVWGRFGGPRSQRQIVEWDQVYDQADYAWSSSGETGEMDFENIATHEVGHAAGMGHPSDGCSEETMYRYADFGETKKRSLNPGDIAGIGVMY